VKSILKFIKGTRPEIFLFVAVLLVFNAPVFAGSVWTSLVFEHGPVLNGEWWRVLTHPLVHVSWYHLFLDTAAFLTLYASLIEPSFFRRMGYIIGAVIGSLLFSLATFTASDQTLCGLSGIAHGLMAISALEMIKDDSSDPATRPIGWLSLALVVGKAIFEAITGKMFLEFLHFGLLGHPVAISHLGGIVGSVIAWWWLRNTPVNAAFDAPKASGRCHRPAF
jgi:rhomboid family GlyGly-CTERM serine protease